MASKTMAGRLGAAQQPVDPVGRRLEAGPLGQRSPPEDGVHPDHVAGLDHLRPEELHHQVGPDVAGPDDRRWHLGGHRHHLTLRTRSGR